MATTVANNDSNPGQYDGQIISAALNSAPTLDQKLVSIRENVKGTYIFKKMSTTDLIQSDSCDYDPTSTLVLSEKTLSITRMQVNQTVCKKDFEDEFEVLDMGDSAWNNLPATFENYLLLSNTAIVADSMETLIWQGDTGSSDPFDGFLTLFEADADSDIVTVDNTTITADNVVGEITKVIQAAPKSILGKSDLLLYVSQNIYFLYSLALGGFGANNQGANGIGGQGFNQGFQGLQFAGTKIVQVPGLPAEQMVLSQRENLMFGTCKTADFSQTEVIDTSKILGDKNVRVVMRFAAGVQYGYGAEIVWYRPA